MKFPIKPWMKTLFILVFLAPAAGYADDGAGNRVPFSLDEVVVTATRQEEDIASVPANVSVVTQEEIENSTARDVPELLRTEVGVHVSDISGNRRSYTVDLRGYGETAGMNTLVLVDGRRVNNPDLSGSDWTLIPLDRIEKVEIIRGGRGSVLYGDNAAGGVINIITKKGRKTKVGAEVAAGSYDTFKADANASGEHKDFSYFLSGNYLTSDGYRDNSDTRSRDFGANLDYFINDNFQMKFNTGYHKDKTHLPGSIKESDFAAGVSRKDTLTPDDFAEVENYYIQAGPEIYFLSDSLFKVDVSFRGGVWFFFSSFSGGTYEGDTEIKTVTVSPQFVIREKLLGLDSKLTFGFDYADDEEKIVNTLFFFGIPDTQDFELGRENYGYFVHEEISLTEALTLSGGYRYDKVKFQFEPSTPDEADMSEDLYTAGMNYSFFGKSSFYFSFSHSFRYPVLDELFNFTENTINTDLDAQTSDDFETGVRLYFGDSLYANLNVFRIDTEDEIFYNSLTYANENLDGKTRRDGVEISVTKKFDQLKLTGNYTYTDATIRGGQFDGMEIPGVPEHQGSFDFAYYTEGGWTFALNGVYVGSRYFISDFDNDFSRQDDYYVLNAKAKYDWNKYSAFLNINNLTDEEYSEYGVLGSFPVQRAYYPSPEINFMVGFSMEL